MRKYILLSLVLSLCFAMSCSGGSAPNPASGGSCLEEKNNLTAGSSKKWEVSEVNLPFRVEDNNGNLIIATTYNVLALPPGIDLSDLEIDFDCLADNSITFFSDSTFIASEGVDVCDGLPANGSGNWALVASCDTILIETLDSVAFLQSPSIPIASLTSNRLSAEFFVDLDTIYSIPVNLGIISGNAILGKEVDIEVVFNAQ